MKLINFFIDSVGVMGRGLKKESMTDRVGKAGCNCMAGVRRVYEVSVMKLLFCVFTHKTTLFDFFYIQQKR